MQSARSSFTERVSPALQNQPRRWRASRSMTATQAVKFATSLSMPGIARIGVTLIQPRDDELQESDGVFLVCSKLDLGRKQLVILKW